MRINTNMLALNTHRQYALSNTGLAKSTERLSSGFRINRAGDDAAGLAISEKMRAQIRGLHMASKNCSDAISLLQTAEGALAETHAILQRMNELAVQAASDTNADIDRNALQVEFAALIGEINDIAHNTKFNGKALLSGMTASIENFTSAARVTVAGAAAGTYTFSIDVGVNAGEMNESNMAFPIYGFTFTEPITTTDANGWYYLGAAANGENIDYLLHDVDGNIIATAENVPVGDAELDFGAYGTIFLDYYGVVDQATIVAALTGGEDSALGFKIEGAGDPLVITIGAKSFSMADAVGEIVPGITLDLSGIDWYSITDLASAQTAVFGAGKTSGSVTVSKSLVIQTGANAGDTLSISIGDMSADALGLSGSSITTHEGASAAITAVQNAIADVASHRASLGAMQNRLQHKINGLDIAAENLQNAESRIRDIDIAREMTEYTRQSILLRAATAMLSQANSAPRSVLKLLKNAK